VQNYILHLEHDRKIAWGSTKVAVLRLSIFLRVTVQNPEMRLAIPPRKNQRRLPEVLSREEVMRNYRRREQSQAPGSAHGHIFGGMRVSEVVSLKLSDLDFSRMTIRVELGKGNKDRYTLLSRRLVKELKNT